MVEENAFDLNVDEKDRYFVNSFIKPRMLYSNPTVFHPVASLHVLRWPS